jgi:hypothetical protein
MYIWQMRYTEVKDLLQFTINGRKFPPSTSTRFATRERTSRLVCLSRSSGFFMMAAASTVRASNSTAVVSHLSFVDSLHRTQQTKRKISSFRREVYEKRVLLGYYAASSDNSLPTFGDKLSVSSSRVEILTLDRWPWNFKMGPTGCLETSVRNYNRWRRDRQVVPKRRQGIITVEDWIDRLSRNVGKEL